MSKGGKDQKIEALFFDVGGVLVDFDGARVLKEIAWEVKGHPLKLARLFWGGGLVEKIERGEILPESLHLQLEREMDFKGGFQRFKKIWCGSFRLLRPAAALLEKAAKRVPVYLLSNTNALHFETICRKYAFPRRVRGSLLSYELGCRKPEPAIYEAAARFAGADPGRCLLIDDLEKNVAAAKQLGWNAVRCRSSVEIGQALSAFRIFDQNKL